MQLLSERRWSERLYDSDHMTFRKKQNYGSKPVKRSVVAKGSRERQRQTKGADVIFRAIKTIQYDSSGGYRTLYIYQSPYNSVT